MISNFHFQEHRVFHYSYDKVQVEQGTKQLQVDINKTIFKKVSMWVDVEADSEECLVGCGGFLSNTVLTRKMSETSSFDV